MSKPHASSSSESESSFHGLNPVGTARAPLAGPGARYPSMEEDTADGNTGALESVNRANHKGEASYARVESSIRLYDQYLITFAPETMAQKKHIFQAESHVRVAYILVKVDVILSSVAVDRDLSLFGPNSNPFLEMNLHIKQSQSGENGIKTKAVRRYIQTMDRAVVGVRKRYLLAYKVRRKDEYVNRIVYGPGDDPHPRALARNKKYIILSPGGSVSLDMRYGISGEGSARVQIRPTVRTKMIFL